MVLVGVLTGLRVGEILALRWRNINFRSVEIRVEQACYRGLIGTPKTKGSRRSLPMPDSLEDELKASERESKVGPDLTPVGRKPVLLKSWLACSAGTTRCPGFLSRKGLRSWNYKRCRSSQVGHTL
jgi:integrase